MPKYVPTGQPPGPRADPERIAMRLTVWRRRARAGVDIEVIAGELHMTRSALNQFIHRQRKAGHPDAVYHANGRPPHPHSRRARRGRGTLTRDTPDC